MRANRYVSYLAAEIEPKALQNLSRFEAATEKTFDRIEAFSSRGRLGMGMMGGALVDPRSTRAAATLSRELRGTRREIDLVDSSVRRTSKDMGVMSTSFTRAGQALNVVQGPLGPLAGRLSALGAVFRELSGITLAGVLGGGGAFALGGIASQYGAVSDRLRPLVTDQAQLNAAMNDVIGISRRARQELDPIAELYAKISSSAKDAGIDQSRVAKITEIAAKAARLSGGSAQAQEAGITQFAQAFGSGTFAGEELKSVRENTLRLAKAIADGLGVPISALKKLGAEGKLTPELVAQALERSAAQIDAEMSRLPLRIGQALTQAGTQVSVFVGQLDESVGATSGLAKAVAFLGDNLNNVAAIGATALAAFNAQAVVASFTAAGRAVSNFAGSQVAAYKAQKAYNDYVREGGDFAYRAAQQNVARAKATEEAARTEFNAARAAADASKASQAQLRAQIPLINQQIAAQKRALEQARLLDAASRAKGGAGNRDLVTRAGEELIRSRQLLINTTQLLEDEERNLARINQQTEASSVRLAQAMTNTDRVIGAMPARVQALSNAKLALNRVMTTLRGAAASLTNFLGGPWGIAFTAAAAVTGYLATRTNLAKEAVDNFKGGQEALAERLGITTGKLREQSAAARDLAIALAEAGVQEAKKKAAAVGGELYDVLLAGSTNIGFQGGTRGQALADRKKLQDLAVAARKGELNIERDIPAIMDIMKRRPQAFEPNFVQRIIGTDPSQAAEKILGASAAVLELRDSEENLAKTRAEVDAANKLPPLVDVSGSGGGMTRAQMVAAAKGMSAADNAVAQARAELAKVTADADAELKAHKITQDEWIQRVGAAQIAVNSAVEAQKAANAARREGTRATKEAEQALKREEVAAEKARDKAQQLANIMGQFEDTPSRVKQGERAKGAIRDLIGERVEGFVGTFSETDYVARAQEIDDSIRKPIEDAIRDQEREIAIQRLILAGRADEAALLQEKYRLVDAVGEILPGDLEILRQNAVELRAINREQEQRNRLVEIYAGAYRDVGNATRDLIRNFGEDPGAAAKEFASRLQDAFKNALADKVYVEIFGDPEQAFREEMTRGLDEGGERLVTAGDRLEEAAIRLSDAAGALSSSAATGPVPGMEQVEGMKQMADVVSDGVSDAVSTTVPPGFGAVEQAAGDIVVTGTRIKRATDTMPKGIVDVFNKIGGDFGSKVFGANSPVTKALGNLGGMMQGMGYGMMASDFAGALGIKQSKTGAMVGSAIGTAIGGPIGGAVGGFLGGTVGGMMKPTKRGSATVTGFGAGDITSRGNSQAMIDASVDAAGGIQDMLTRVAEALGGDLGSFAVSIGMRKDKWRVDPSGRGITKTSKGAVDFGDDAEAAMRYAVLNALKDGAIKGIREGAQRLLRAGKDLETALDKAVKFNNVFKRLKAYVDPVGAAIDDVNQEFSELVRIFNEAGASSAEMAALRKLYDYERAEAVKGAAESAVGVLQDFINANKASTESPLGRRTVYENAKAEVDKFRADIAAGKMVNQDDLVEALQNWQEASRELNGSRTAFFADFEEIMALAQKAVSNYPVLGAGTGDPGTSAPVPGGLSPEIAALLYDLRDTGGGTNEILIRGFDALIAAVRGRGGSSIDILPGNNRGRGENVGGSGGGTRGYYSNAASNFQVF